jgi:DHA1 family chloramphenicol resistance protein-like MFS transporter
MDDRAGTENWAFVGLLAFTTFAYVTYTLQLTPLLTALSREFGASESAIGQLATIGALVSTGVAIGVAPWMERWPRRDVLTAQIALLAAAAALMAAAQSYEMLTVARIVGGIGAAALLGTCFTAASEIVTGEGKLGRAVALVASGTTMAVLAGVPALVIIASWQGWRWASAVTGALLLAVLPGIRRLPDARRRREGGAESYFASMLAVLRHGPALWMLLASAILFLAYFGWIVYYAAYLEDVYGAGAGLIGLLFLAGGVSELAANLGGPPLFGRIPVALLTMLGAAGLGLTLLGSGVVFRTSGSQFALVVLLHVFTSFAYIGTSILFLGMLPERRGTVMALASASTGLGGAAGALAAGVLLAVFDDYERTYQALGVVMLAGAGCVAAARR